MFSKEFKEKYLPIQVMAIGLLISFVLILICLLIAPYVELHSAHNSYIKN